MIAPAEATEMVARTYKTQTAVATASAGDRRILEQDVADTQDQLARRFDRLRGWQLESRRPFTLNALAEGQAGDGLISR